MNTTTVHCCVLTNKAIYYKCPCPQKCKMKYHSHGNVDGMDNRIEHRGSGGGSHCLGITEGNIEIVIDDKTCKLYSMDYFPH